MLNTVRANALRTNKFTVYQLINDAFTLFTRKLLTHLLIVVDLLACLCFIAGFDACCLPQYFTQVFVDLLGFKELYCVYFVLTHTNFKIKYVERELKILLD